MKNPQKILTEYSLNMQYRRGDFKKTNSCNEFDIFKNSKEEGLELAILRKCSIPHYHTAEVYFCFLKDAELILGGLDEEGLGRVKTFHAKKNEVYTIPAYVIHAAGPIKGEESVELLIYSPQGNRERSSEYPNDTFKPDQIHWL